MRSTLSSNDIRFLSQQSLVEWRGTARLSSLSRPKGKGLLEGRPPNSIANCYYNPLVGNKCANRISCVPSLSLCVRYILNNERRKHVFGEVDVLLDTIQQSRRGFQMDGKTGSAPFPQRPPVVAAASNFIPFFFSSPSVCHLISSSVSHILSAKKRHECTIQQKSIYMYG